MNLKASSRLQAERIVEVRDLDKSFAVEGRELEALKGVSLAVNAGEFVSLLGPSGCGKTTLLNIIAGLVPRTAGTVLFKSLLHERPRRDVGMMFQSPVLLPWRTVEQNILLPAEILHLNMDEMRNRVREVLDLVGLSGFKDQRPSQLSGGMAQRVALCRLLVFDPDMLLMDEPFGALDEFTREAMDMELLRVWGTTSKTVIFVTHNITEAVLLSDRVVVMTPRPGRIADIVTPDLPRPRTPEMLGSESLIRCVQQIRSTLGVAELT